MLRQGTVFVQFFNNGTSPDSVGDIMINNEPIAALYNKTVYWTLNNPPIVQPGGQGALYISIYKQLAPAGAPLSVKVQSSASGAWSEAWTVNTVADNSPLVFGYVFLNQSAPSADPSITLILRNNNPTLPITLVGLFINEDVTSIASMPTSIVAANGSLLVVTVTYPTGWQVPTVGSLINLGATYRLGASETILNSAVSVRLFPRQQ